MPYGNFFYHFIPSSDVAINDYATEILGSKASLRILKTLLRYRGKIFTMRELARTAGFSHPETSRVLRGLERRGVVKLQPVGRAQLVSLNEESYILKSVVEPLFEAEKETLSSLISTIRPFFRDTRISSIAIFGSVARGLEKGASDIDLLVLTEDDELANARVALANQVSVSKFGFALSPLVLSRARFIRDRNRDLEKSILES